MEGSKRGTGSSCVTCNKWFQTEQNLKQHMNTHANRERKECPMCKKKVLQLQLHMKYMHTEQPMLTCDICDARVKGKIGLRIHMRYHSKGWKRPCPVCKKECFELKRHMLLHDKDRPKYECTKCSKVFVQKENLRKHSLTHQEKQDKTICLICKKSYVDIKEHLKMHTTEKNRKTCPVCKHEYARTYLPKHMLSHNEKGTPTFSCSDCDYKSTEKGNLKRHVRYRHTEREKQACSICQKRVLNLDLHLKRKHSGKAETISCRMCDKILDKEHLKRHLEAVHYGRKTEKCPLCQKKTTRLRKHMLLHDKHRPRFVCNTCNKTFSMQKSLEKHMALHKNPDEYRKACPICHTNVVNMASHLTTHNLEKSFKCRLCYAKYGTRSRLRSHVMTHFAAHKKSCPICHKRISKKYIPMHTRVMHSEGSRKLFQCGYCDKQLTTEPHLRRHNQRFHSNGTESTKDCPICAKSISKANLTAHLQTHDPNKIKFSCHNCQKTFHTKSGVQNHIFCKDDFHNNRTKKCRICKKEVSLLSMRQHMGLHKPNRKLFQCVICLKKFVTQRSLKYHLTMNHHKSAKPTHICGICQRAFMFKANLDNHKVTHDPHRALYNCTLCSKVFTLKGNLKRHVVIHRQDKEQKDGDEFMPPNSDGQEYNNILNTCTIIE